MSGDIKILANIPALHDRAGDHAPDDPSPSSTKPRDYFVMANIPALHDRAGDKANHLLAIAISLAKAGFLEESLNVLRHMETEYAKK